MFLLKRNTILHDIRAFCVFQFHVLRYRFVGNMAFNISTVWSACAKGVWCSAMKPTISGSAFAVNSLIFGAEDSFSLKRIPIFMWLLAAFIAFICLSDDACLNNALCWGV